MALSAACGEAAARWLVGARQPTPEAMARALARRSDAARAPYRVAAGPIPATAPMLSAQRKRGDGGDGDADE